MASDQRYCLECGQRRGDPRLPFMDAVVLMEAVKQSRQPPPPQPPKRKRGGISPNAALIAGIGTLLLALGIGVLIGHSGTQEVAQTAAAPQVITVGGGSGKKPPPPPQRASRQRRRHGLQGKDQEAEAGGAAGIRSAPGG